MTWPTKQDLDEMQAVCSRATPGPWRTERHGAVLVENHQVALATGQVAMYDLAANPVEVQRNNADFISHARTDWPRLIEWARQASVELQALRDIAEVACEFIDYPCVCSSLSDQGAICRVCLLKERFKALDAVEDANGRESRRL